MIVAPRKNGKTAMLAALSLYRLLTSEGRPEILLAAPSDKVAGRLFDAGARFVRRSPELSKLLRVRDHAGEIVREDGMGIDLPAVVGPAAAVRLQPDARGVRRARVMDDAEPAPCVCGADVGWRCAVGAAGVHDHDRGRGDAAARLDPRLDPRRRARRRRLEREPGLTVCRMHDASTLVWEYAAPTTDPRDIEAMKLANPASWITEEFLRRQAENPELTDAQVLQLHGCVWAASSSTWIAPDAVGRTRRRARRIALGAKIVIGFDGSAPP